MLGTSLAHAATVLMVTKNQLSVAISHDPAGDWVVGDRVCVYANDLEVGCGNVVSISIKGAIVRIDRKKKPQLKRGTKFGCRRRAKRQVSSAPVKILTIGLISAI